MNQCGIQSKMSTSRHPQTDGTTQIMNRIINKYLRCYSAFHRCDWDSLLTSAELAYSSARVDSLSMSPFEADLGWPSKSILDSIVSHEEDSIQTVTDFRNKLEETFRSATFAQRLAQARQTAYNSSVRPSQKLSVRKVGPFCVTKVIIKKAVRVELPDNTSVHPVIHVEHTARAHRQPADISKPLETQSQPFIDEYVAYVVEVEKNLAHRRRGQRFQFLTQLRNSPLHEAERKPLRDYLGPDGTITDALHTYIKAVGILPVLEI